MSFFIPAVAEDLVAAAGEMVEVDSIQGLADAWHKELEDRTHAMTKELHDLAQDATAYMKQNAPWQDRTGNARASLYCKITVQKNGPEMDGEYFSIDVEFGYDDSICDYGDILEEGDGGNLAIVGPTANIYGPKIDDIVAKYWS
jgi:hypothetical protein